MPVLMPPPVTHRQTVTGSRLRHGRISVQRVRLVEVLGVLNIVAGVIYGITNAVAEGLNSKIMSIKRRVGGYRNRENFKTAIFFYCGGLDLYPR